MLRFTLSPIWDPVEDRFLSIIPVEYINGLVIPQAGRRLKHSYVPRHSFNCAEIASAPYTLTRFCLRAHLSWNWIHVWLWRTTPEIESRILRIPICPRENLSELWPYHINETNIEIPDVIWSLRKPILLSVLSYFRLSYFRSLVNPEGSNALPAHAHVLKSPEISGRTYIVHQCDRNPCAIYPSILIEFRLQGPFITV